MIDAKQRQINELKDRLRRMTEQNAELQSRNNELELRIAEVFNIAVGAAK